MPQQHLAFSMNDLGTITSVSDFLEKTEGVHYHSREVTRFLCRGQGSIRLQLRPKIGRYKYAVPSSGTEKPTWQRNFEIMFSQFERDYVAHYPTRLDCKIDRLTLAQHYGLATQLLDWTLNPLIALFFSCDPHNDHDGIVFIYPPHPGNIFSNFDLNNQNSTQILRPIRLNQRMINQDTVFTYHGDPTKDFAEELEDKCNGVVVPHDRKPFIRKQLESIGIHNAFIYPGLSSVCDRIDEAYRGRYSFEENKGHYPEEEPFADERSPYLTKQKSDINKAN